MDHTVSIMKVIIFRPLPRSQKVMADFIKWIRATNDVWCAHLCNGALLMRSFARPQYMDRWKPSGSYKNWACCLWSQNYCLLAGRWNTGANIEEERVFVVLEVTKTNVHRYLKIKQ